MSRLSISPDCESDIEEPRKCFVGQKSSENENELKRREPNKGKFLSEMWHYKSQNLIDRYEQSSRVSDSINRRNRSD